MLGALIGFGFWWGLYLLAYRRSRRRVRNGVLLLLALHATLTLQVRFVETVMPFGDLMMLLGSAMVLLGTLVLAILLILNGIVVVRKEGRSLGNLLSGLAGLVLLAAPAAAAALGLSGTRWGLVLGALIAVVALYLGLAFSVFLAASVPYQLFPKPLRSTGIIVHGSGLVRGRVPRLLRSRLDRAVRERERLLAEGIDPVLVPSGGRGADEPRAEAEAMAEYLLEEASVPAGRVLPETASRTTEENLILSHRLLEEAGHQGPFIVATSRYHAFRAALLARSLGFADEAIGGPTTFYFVPSATLREFVAVVSYRKGWNALLLLPALVLVAVMAFSLPTA
jgi:uncharacterized SAM-binding protein YcdF (DUF218 family)